MSIRGSAGSSLSTVAKTGNEADSCPEYLSELQQENNEYRESEVKPGKRK